MGSSADSLMYMEYNKYLDTLDIFAQHGPLFLHAALNTDPIPSAHPVRPRLADSPTALFEEGGREGGRLSINI